MAYFSGLLHCGQVSAAAARLRNCDLNDFSQAVERPSNRIQANRSSNHRITDRTIASRLSDRRENDRQSKLFARNIFGL